MLDRIGSFDPATQSEDDLQKLHGVGPMMEQKLHQVGIYTYQQVSKLSAEDYVLLERVIDTFPVAENRGNWNEQANQLKK
jgi:molybdopterin-containing oxidoreductase family membrane subunit